MISIKSKQIINIQKIIVSLPHNINNKAMKHTNVGLLSLASLPGALLAQEATSDTRPIRPNVVMIYADDLGFGDLECYGAVGVKTPNVNRLSEHGLRFTNAHAVA